VPTFRRLLPAGLFGLALVLSGCGGHPDVERQISVAPGPSGATFQPVTITVNKDDNVRLAIGNPTTSAHGFSIEGYGIQDQVPPGGMEKKFQAVHPGTYKIYCQLHETHQVATLIVQ
jgi:hypothetical protein